MANAPTPPLAPFPPGGWLRESCTCLRPGPFATQPGRETGGTGAQHPILAAGKREPTGSRPPPTPACRRTFQPQSCRATPPCSALNGISEVSAQTNKPIAGFSQNLPTHFPSSKTGPTLGSSLHTHIQPVLRVCWLRLSLLLPHPGPGRASMGSRPLPGVSLSPQPRHPPCVSLTLSLQLKTSFKRKPPGRPPPRRSPCHRSPLPPRSYPWPLRSCSSVPVPDTVTSGPLHLLFFQPKWLS